MSSTELADLEALILRVLPDPMGFAEKVFQQLIDRLAAGDPTEITSSWSPVTIRKQPMEGEPE